MLDDYLVDGLGGGGFLLPLSVRDFRGLLTSPSVPMAEGQCLANPWHAEDHASELAFTGAKLP